MNCAAIDSRVFRNLFGTQEIRDIFSDEAYVRYLIETEAGLARAESKAGVIPEDVGKALTKHLTEVKIEYAIYPTFPSRFRYRVNSAMREYRETLTLSDTQSYL